MNDDWQLLNDYAARNSEDAFRTLVDRYAPMVYHAALRQARNPHLAQEVTQAVFIALARKAGRIPRQTILYGWLFRAARFALLNLMRDEACRRRHEQEAKTMETIHHPEDPDTDPVWEQISPHLDDALDRLSQADREVVMIRYFGNQSHREIATALGISEDTAKKRLSRAMEKLRGIFARRGVVVPSLALMAALTTSGAQAAPAGLATATAAAALAKGAAGAASTAAVAKSILRWMAWAKAKTAIAVGAGVVLAAAGTATVVMNPKTSASGDVVSQLASQSGKLIVADKHLDLPATPDLKNIPLEKALDKLAVQAGAYWSIDYVVYDSDAALRQLVDLLHEGGELQSRGWSNLSSQFVEPSITLQMSSPEGGSRNFLRMRPATTNAVDMIVVMNPKASATFGPSMDGGPVHLSNMGAGSGPPPGSPMALIRQAMDEGVADGVLAPQRLLGQTAVVSNMTLATPLPADAKTAARLAKSARAKWTTIYTLRKSPLPGAGIKLVHAGMENMYAPANLASGQGNLMQNMQSNRFNLSPEDRDAHDRAVAAFKQKK